MLTKPVPMLTLPVARAWTLAMTLALFVPAKPALATGVKVVAENAVVKFTTVSPGPPSVKFVTL